MKIDIQKLQEAVNALAKQGKYVYKDDVHDLAEDMNLNITLSNKQAQQIADVANVTFGRINPDVIF